jgi:hypothetical protein
MRLRLVGLFVVMFVLASGAVQAIPITYLLSFSSGANTLMGTITTNGMTGIIQPGDITAWAFTASGNPMFTISGPPITACGGTGCFSATLSTLSLPDDFAVNFDSQGELIAFAGGSIPYSDFPATVTWTDLGTGVGAGTAIDGSQVGTAAVPEPSTLVLLGSALAAFAGVARKRARQRQSTAV